MRCLIRTGLCAIVIAAVLAVRPAAQPGPAKPADPSLWTIDGQHSAASFAVRHMMVSTVRGSLGPIQGSVWYDGKDVSSIRADATIDVTHLASGDAARDTDLRGADFFAADQFPTVTFKSKRIVAGTGGQFKMIGDLTIRGTTKEVTLDVDNPAPILKTTREERTAAMATTTVNRFDYGLKWNRLIETGGAIVGPDVKITIDLEIKR